MSLTWYVCDLKTGEIRDELPLTATTQLERTVGAAHTCSVTLPVNDPACPPNWDQLLLGGRTMIAAVNNDTPLIGYLLGTAQPGGPEIPIGLTTLEAILDADYCPDADFTNTDESQIAEALTNARLTAQFGLTLDVTDCGKTTDRAYYASEDRTIGSALTELMTGGGPEWMIHLEWDDPEHTRFRKVLQIADEVGNRIESTVFANEHVSSRHRPRDWRPGKYANGIQATGDGAGDSRPISALVVDEDAIASGAPLWVERVNASAIDDDSALDTHAAAVLQRRRYGSQTWELELATKVASTPRIGVDFDAGDTVTMQLEPTSWDPASWHAPARIIGWRATPQGRTLTGITPVFWQPTDEAVG